MQPAYHPAAANWYFLRQGVKTNVLFFTRGPDGKGGDKATPKRSGFYDLRANMPQYGKRTALTRVHFAEFEAAFGNDPLGGPKSLKKRKDGSEAGRFRRFTREEIATVG